MKYEPQLATLVRAAPAGDGWLHEIKYDGCRIGCRIERGEARLLGRRGNDWTGDFPSITAAAHALPVRSALLDGEVAVLLPDGRTSSRALRNVSARDELVYFVFDLLELNGRDLSGRPLHERKRELAKIVPAEGLIRIAPHWLGGGPRVFHQACVLGFEGLVSKRRDQPHHAGRSAGWVETKCVERQESVAGGFSEPSGSRAGIGAPREDMIRREVVRERPVVASIALSHPERVVFPDVPLTKLELARYHEQVADWELPHLRGRPLTLLRCASDISDCAFMKHSKVWAPDALRRVRVQEKKKLGEYLIADTVEAVIALVQMDVIELHTWNTRDTALELPDRIVIDLDPGPEVPWRQVVDAARLVREALDAMGLRSFVKTTGGTGLHVVIPLVPAAGWTECLAFSRHLAETIARQHPKTYTTRFAKAGREKKILIDYLRNNRTNTSVAPFSPRARAGAPVSVPVTWEELSARLDPARFTVKSVPRRLRGLRSDPWKELWSVRQRLTPQLIEAVRAL